MKERLTQHTIVAQIFVFFFWFFSKVWPTSHNGSLVFLVILGFFEGLAQFRLWIYTYIKRERERERWYFPPDYLKTHIIMYIYTYIYIWDAPQTTYTFVFWCSFIYRIIHTASGQRSETHSKKTHLTHPGSCLTRTHE